MSGEARHAPGPASPPVHAVVFVHNWLLPILTLRRAGGVLEAVRIACAGFPTRKPMLQFAQRYAVLLPGRGTGGGGVALRLSWWLLV